MGQNHHHHHHRPPPPPPTKEKEKQEKKKKKRQPCPGCYTRNYCYTCAKQNHNVASLTNGLHKQINTTCTLFQNREIRVCRVTCDDPTNELKNMPHNTNAPHIKSKIPYEETFLV